MRSIITFLTIMILMESWLLNVEAINLSSKNSLKEFRDNNFGLSFKYSNMLFTEYNPHGEADSVKIG